MDLHRGTFAFLLLLPLTRCLAVPNVVLKELISTEADVTPICSMETRHLHVLCRIWRGNVGGLCHLKHHPGHLLQSDCGPRTTLLFQNQTAFLQLRDLTLVDSGVYECGCYGNRGLVELSVNVTVRDNHSFSTDAPEISDSNQKADIYRIIIPSASALVVMFAVIVAVIYKRRRRSRTRMSGGEDKDTYAELQKPTSDLYQTIVRRSSAGASGQHLQEAGEYANIQ